jgi:hypothetical protein
MVINNKINLRSNGYRKGTYLNNKSINIKETKELIITQLKMLFPVVKYKFL